MSTPQLPSFPCCRIRSACTLTRPLALFSPTGRSLHFNPRLPTALLSSTTDSSLGLVG